LLQNNVKKHQKNKINAFWLETKSFQMKKLWKVFENFSNGLERARSIMRWNDAREQYPGTSLIAWISYFKDFSKKLNQSWFKIPLMGTKVQSKSPLQP